MGVRWEGTHLISVIITAYNVAGFIRQAVESVLAQSYRDIEIIIVDDGSTDGSSDVLRDLNDPRLRIVRADHAGSARARNAGLRLATGTLVAFLDGDDKWAPENLARQTAFLSAHPEIDLSFGHSLVIDEEGRTLGFRCSSWAGTLDLAQLLRADQIGNGSCVLVRREALDRAGWFNPKLTACLDIDVWMRVALLRPNNIAAIPDVLTFYRRRRGQISGNWRRMEAAYIQLLDEWRRAAPLAFEQEEKRSRAGRYRNYARLALEDDQPKTALRLLATSLSWAPLWLLCDSRTWVIGVAIAFRLVLPRPLYSRAAHLGQRLLGAQLP